MTAAADRGATVRAIAEQQRDEAGALLPILHAVQAEFGHVQRADVVAIADVLNLSVADVHGVLSFYPDFRTTPAPAHTVRLCRAEACQAVGAQALFDATAGSFAERDDVEVRHVFCFGNCALGPSGEIDGRLYGRLDEQRIAELSAGWSR